MNNPWEDIRLCDYENHMKSDEVMQLQFLNRMTEMQLKDCKYRTLAFLGVAGGNGLEYVIPESFDKVYGIDVNADYLAVCNERYASALPVLETMCADLKEERAKLSKADMVIANLLVEYIGYDCFKRAVRKMSAKYVSCIIQRNDDIGFVSNSPYSAAFERLSEVCTEISENELNQAMSNIGFIFAFRDEQTLPNGKILVRLDYERNDAAKTKMAELSGFLDVNNKLTAFPSKRKTKIKALFYIAEKLEKGKTFTEKEMNEQLNKWHTFEDPATLRRELYNNKFIDRDPYGHSYWVEDEFPTEEELLKKYE